MISIVEADRRREVLRALIVNAEAALRRGNGADAADYVDAVRDASGYDTIGDDIRRIEENKRALQAQIDAQDEIAAVLLEIHDEGMASFQQLRERLSGSRQSIFDRIGAPVDDGKGLAALLDRLEAA